MKEKEKEEKYSTSYLIPKCTVARRNERKFTQDNSDHKWTHVQVYDYTENVAKEQNAVDQTFLGAFCKTEK